MQGSFCSFVAFISIILIHRNAAHQSVYMPEVACYEDTSTPAVPSSLQSTRWVGKLSLACCNSGFKPGPGFCCSPGSSSSIMVLLLCHHHSACSQVPKVKPSSAAYRLRARVLVSYGKNNTSNTQEKHGEHHSTQHHFFKKNKNKWSKSSTLESAIQPSCSHSIRTYMARASPRDAAI